MLYVLLLLITLNLGQIQATTELVETPTDIINEHLRMWEGEIKRESRRKRAVVVFAPHLTLPLLQKRDGTFSYLKRAKYGAPCITEFFRNYTLPVYDLAAIEDDSLYGVFVNESVVKLMTELKTRTALVSVKDATNSSTTNVDSWLQAGCIGWYPMNCSTMGGNESPTCRCFNSPLKDTPTRHHPHYIQEGGRCRVDVGGFCRYHPQYKSGAKCARNGQCVNHTCVLVAFASEAPTFIAFSGIWKIVQVILLSLLVCLKNSF